MLLLLAAFSSWTWADYNRRESDARYFAARCEVWERDRTDITDVRKEVVARGYRLSLVDTPRLDLKRDGITEWTLSFTIYPVSQITTRGWGMEVLEGLDGKVMKAEIGAYSVKVL